jgi:hypothetical protein
VAGGGTGRHLKITGRYSRFTPQSLRLDYRDDAYVSLGTPEEHKSANRRDQVLAVLPIVGAGLTAMEGSREDRAREEGRMGCP